MKKKLLILTNNPVAKIGINSYLSSIFSQYLSIESARVTDISRETLDSADCILFSTDNVKDKLPCPLPERMGQLFCMRTFNHTYLHKILQIPPGSAVYLVNDTEKNTYEVIRQLEDYGFSQYHFLPWHPGCTDLDEEIRYAVTPGELHLVPKTIRTVIDIGNRVVDISTINEIIAFFHLPTSLADEVTRNYMSHIVQVLKLSNHQLSHSLDMKQTMQILMDNISDGICMTDKSGKIEMVNAAFCSRLGFKEKNPVGASLSSLLVAYGIPYDFPREREAVVEKPDAGRVRLWYQRVNIRQNAEMYLLHAAPAPAPAAEDGRAGSFPMLAAGLYDFKHIVTKNPVQLHMLDTARRVSLNDFPIIIQGESGTEKEMLAQAIHQNSRRHNGPFVSLSFTSLNSAGVEEELLGCEENPSLGTRYRQGALAAASGGTLFISGIEHTAMETQKLLLNILQNGYYTAKGGGGFHSVSARIIAATSSDLYAQVLEGRFLDDLFFLLNTVSLSTVPIRRRREDIPLLMNHFLKNAFKDPAATMERVLSDNLISFLKQYDWPGNAREINNLCCYFSCLYRRELIPLGDLPGYILNQIRNREDRLDVTDKHILSLIIANPRIGRSTIQARLKENGITLSEGKIRTILQKLSACGYVKVHRTRGGCEATELGVLMNRA